jgi:hypothetical protein
MEFIMATGSASIKKIVEPYVPSGLLDAAKRLKNHKEEKKRTKFEDLRGSVHATIDAIHNLSPQQCLDEKYLEQTFIPSLGLNDELLHEQPSEFSRNFGKGLHIWQYPNQLAAYLVWLNSNAIGIKSFMEIGCRWGGMFILVSEWLRKSGADLETVIALDLVKPTPFIDEYFKYLKTQKSLTGKEIATRYIRDFSTSQDVKNIVASANPDMVFIDGDHSMTGVLSDHMMVRDFAKIIVHHDINSHSCPDTTQLWAALRKFEVHEFDFFEFDQQYSSVKGNFLGIGAMKRRDKKTVNTSGFLA